MGNIESIKKSQLVRLFAKVFVTAFLLFLSWAMAFGLPWSEPLQNPPTANLRAPLNIGPLTQYKYGPAGTASTGQAGVPGTEDPLGDETGRLGANDFRFIQFSAGLAGPLTWISQLVNPTTGCGWQGLRCHCNAAGGSTAILGMECTNGILTNFQFMSFIVSDNLVPCSPTNPYPSQCSSYSYGL